MISEAALEEKISELLEILYEKRFGALNKLTLTVLLSKNPYLYRSLGINKHAELIDQLLAARVSSSDETIFGNSFLEPLALWSAENAIAHGDDSRTACVGAGAGFDVAIESSHSYLAVAVKSGKNIFNSQSAKGQASEFEELQARLLKMKKQFRKIVGYGYGRNTARKASTTEKVAGQEFWELLTGEEDFYLRIAKIIGDLANHHAPAYKEAYDKKTNLLVNDFMFNFLEKDGSVSWDKIVAFNSGKEKPRRLAKHDAPSKPKKSKVKKKSQPAVQIAIGSPIQNS